MRIPSRRMPKLVHTGVKPLGWIILAALLGCFVYALWSSPLKTGSISLSIFVLFWILSWFDARRWTKRLTALAATREGDSICTFAREFEKDSLDTWVVRAMYEETQANIPYAPKFPLRATDRFTEDLGLDDDCLEDIARDVAQRAGRTLEASAENPFFGKVKTVGDAVRFITNQAKVQPNHLIDRPAAREE
jgi:hypothetical protein